MLSKQDFYALMEETAYGVENTLLHIVAGQNREKSGFYELCYAFAAATNTTEFELDTVTQKLREIVCQFCDRHHLVRNDALMELINRSYVKLLPQSIQDIRVEKSDLYTGGLIGFFPYHPALPSEVWSRVFDNNNTAKEK